MAKVWSGKLDCTFHGKMHWELNEELWFLSQHIVEHRGEWEQLGVKIVYPRESGWGDKMRVYAPKGYHTDLASIPRAGWILVAPWDVARAAIIHDILYGALRDAFRNGSMNVTRINEMRKAADNVFREGMQAAEPKIPNWKSSPCFWSVRPFGRWAIRKEGKDFKI
jgi:hypothetical protein